MIIRTAFRRAGELAAHLGRTDTNERVETLDALCRDCPADDGQALRLFTAISRSNPRTRRDLVHTKMSPGTVVLSIDQIGAALTRYEAEHGIPPTMPRKVKRHTFGNRPPHVHVVYPVVDPATGQAVRSQNNFLADELASRWAEVEFGEAIVPGPRQEQVVRTLRARGERDLAQALHGYEPAAVGDRVGDAGFRQAAAVGVDLGRIKHDVGAAWTAANGNSAPFMRALEVAGLKLCQGSRVILVVEKATGAAFPLARTLRQRAKERGDDERVREPMLRATLGALPDLAAVRTQALAKAQDEANYAVSDELVRMAEEAALDGQQQLAERLRRVRENMASLRRQAFKTTLAEQRRRIAADYARRDRLRRARVLRAARIAGMLGHRDVRRTGMLVASTIILAGGGLGLALVVAGFAVASLPTRERVRAMALDAKLRRAEDRDYRARDMAAAFKSVAAQYGPAHNESLQFYAIPKRLRVVAGVLAHLTISRAERPLAPHLEIVRQATARVLGPSASRIEESILNKGGRGGLIVCGWYQPQTARGQQAFRAALLSAGEWDAVAAWDGSGQHKSQRGSNRRFGKGTGDREI